jgi:anti-anti-sigma regulatory factor
MNSSCEDGAAHSIRLEGSLGLRDAKRVHELLKNAVGGFRAVEIDVSAVEGIDISIIQLIASARKSAEQRQRMVTLSGSPAEAFTATLVKVGLLGSDGACRSTDEAFWAGRSSALEITS